MNGRALRPGPVRDRLTSRIRASAAAAAGRLVFYLLRAAGRSATTLPGRLALALDPDLLRRMARGLRVILVTGTNGKTTTARMMTGILLQTGASVADNPAGANLASGLMTALLTRISGDRQAHSRPFAVLEVDEAAFAATASVLAPEVCVVTNIFRDQLDRYGERDTMRGFIAQGLADAAASRGEAGITFVLCADDPLCESLADAFGSSAGVRILRTGMERADMQDGDGAGELPGEAAHCPDCHARYRYRAVAYGHLGDYACPSCGRGRPLPDVRFRLPLPDAPGRTSFVRSAEGGGPETSVPTRISIPGVHNLYNASSALAAVSACGVPFERACGLLSEVTPAFGRMERLTLAGRTVWMILVKNPAGMDRALEHVCAAPDAGAVYFLLNSGDADGRDTSWIWDARFEDRSLPEPVFVSGRRTWDMALRLRYAGLPSSGIRAGEDTGALLEEALASLPPETSLYLLPNYTAMLDLRAGPLKRFGIRVFGEEGRKR